MAQPVPIACAALQPGEVATLCELLELEELAGEEVEELLGGDAPLSPHPLSKATIASSIPAMTPSPSR